MLTKLLTQKICTKNERFTTFTILRQISVNAFEIRYFYAHCLFLTPFFINHLRGTAKKWDIEKNQSSDCHLLVLKYQLCANSGGMPGRAPDWNF